MKIQSIAIVTCLSTLLSSCMTLSTVESMNQSSYKYKTLISDQLLAYGIPREPIIRHENALVILGQKQDYLIEVVNRSSSKKTILVDIVKQLDLSHVTISASSRVSNHLFSVVITDPKHPIMETLNVSYNKALNQVTNSEKNQLKALDFSCETDLNAQKYQCTQQIHYKIFPLKKQANQKPLQYQFREPVQLLVRQQSERSGLFKAAHVAILPLTVVADIVTLPIQLVGFSKALSDGH